MSDSSFPVAKVSVVGEPWCLRISRWWIATALSVALAIGLAWVSLRSAGPKIVIRFSEGHGLKPGDVLRHRGIDIGVVETIELGDSLEAVTVQVGLAPSASAIACDGSKFWIVRPQLDLTGISGLETAVGAKYIAVAPGRSRLKKHQFDGLDNPPPDGLRRTGLELVLRGEQRFGVNPGSPLTWRGVEVGTVLSSGLSPDARNVDTHVLVFDPYRRLVSRNTKFWVTSGFDLQLGMTGVELSADSLASIARGGIGLITPDADRNDQVSSGNTGVQAGDVFTLHPSVNDQWVSSASAINLLLRPIPEIGRLKATWKQKTFGFTRDVEATGSGLLIRDDESAVLLLPADLATIPERAIEGSFELVYTCNEDQLNITPQILSTSQVLSTSQAEVVSRDSPQGQESISEPIERDPRDAHLIRLPLNAERIEGFSPISVDRLRIPVSPEDCFAVKGARHGQSGRGDADAAVVLQMIGKHQLQAEDGVWRIFNDSLNREIWHGAAVIASDDEKVIGMLIVEEGLPSIFPLSPLDVP